MVPWRPVIQVIALRVLGAAGRVGGAPKCQEWLGATAQGPEGVVGVLEGAPWRL